MSQFFLPNTEPYIGSIFKDASAIRVETQYQLCEVQRWDVAMYHLWPKSRWIGLGDSTSDPLCPDILNQPAQYEWVEYNDFKCGSKYILLYKIEGVTKDSIGNPLGGCVVDLFRTFDRLRVDSVVSDDAGNYRLYTPYITDDHYCIAYKATAPDVTGGTVNTLRGSA